MNDQSQRNQLFVVILSWCALLVALACLAAMAWYIPTNRSHATAIFRDFNLELPAAGRLIHAIPDIAFPIGAALIGLGAFTMQFLIRSKGNVALLHMLIILLCCVTFEVYREAMGNPMIELIEGITAQSTRR